MPEEQVPRVGEIVFDEPVQSELVYVTQLIDCAAAKLISIKKIVNH